MQLPTRHCQPRQGPFVFNRLHRGSGPTTNQDWVGAPPALELPYDHERPNIRRFTGGAHTLRFDAELTNALQELASDEGTTLQ